MARKKRETNFWVSYSDLATGMMIIFMVVMLLMIAIQKKKSNAQQEAVNQVVTKLGTILKTKPKFAEKNPTWVWEFKEREAEAPENRQCHSATLGAGLPR